MQSKCKVIAVANQKGDVGKTTTTEHLGIGLAKADKKVLLIDLDPHANLTASLGWKNVDALKKTVSDVLEAIMLEKDVSFEDMILHHDEGVDLIPSNIRLADIDQRLTGAFVKEKTLTKGIEGIKKDYDYILIDCPPTLGNLSDYENDLNTLLRYVPVDTLNMYNSKITNDTGTKTIHIGRTLELVAIKLELINTSNSIDLTPAYPQQVNIEYRW